MKRTVLLILTTVAAVTAYASAASAGLTISDRRYWPNEVNATQYYDRYYAAQYADGFAPEGYYPGAYPSPYPGGYPGLRRGWY